MHGHLRLDLLVEADLHEVDVDQLAADRMELLVLDDHRARVAVDREVDQRARADEHAAQRALLDGERDGVALGSPVDHAGHQPLLAQAARDARAELLALADLQADSLVGHGGEV